jgi:LysR family hydrogen peroxide-inducible transcriptional activator
MIGMITLRQLRYLGALADHRHFGRAAETCAVSQPALSMQIRELEKFLGVELVERRPSEVVLTDVGAEVARRGERVLAASRDLVDFARHRSRLLTGRLTLGVIPTLAPYVLPKVLPMLQRRYGELHVDLRETQTKVLLDELQRGALDVVMLALPVPEAEVETIRLFEDAFLLAVPADDPRPPTARVNAGDIDQRRLILLEEGHCLRDQALAYCANARHHGAPGRGATGGGAGSGRANSGHANSGHANSGYANSLGAMGLGATSLATVMQMVANGYGVTLVPQVAVDVEVRDERVKLLRFAAPQPARTIGLAWRHTSPRKVDFVALGQLVTEALGVAERNPSDKRYGMTKVARTTRGGRHS